MYLVVYDDYILKEENKDKSLKYFIIRGVDTSLYQKLSIKWDCFQKKESRNYMKSMFLKKKSRIRWGFIDS